MKKAILCILALALVAALLLLWLAGGFEWLQANYGKVCKAVVLIALLLFCLDGKRRMDRLDH